MNSGRERRRSKAQIALVAMLVIAALCVATVLTVAAFSYKYWKEKHTLVYLESENALHPVQIKPLFGPVKVSCDCDTDVVFTDVETGESYVIGYITSGVSEGISLEKDKWYTVVGKGRLEISQVDVMISHTTEEN